MLGGTAFQPGQILAGKYRIDRIVGQGGMGVVLGGRHLDLDFDVAIKVLLPAALGNEEAVERFMREGKASAKLTTPHVARVYDVGRLSNDMPFLVMEFLRGKDLKELVESRGAQPLADVVRWTLEAAEALSEAHSHGIVHRDVKPANLFLTDMPNGRTSIKLLDFGISKTLAPGSVDLTRTASSMGSPLYMAPEQVQSAKHVDPRVDIWALGVVMYESATAHVPFDGGHLPEVIAAILQKTPLLPSHHVASIPKAFDDIVMRCLDKRPESRFQTAAELIQALDAFRQRLPDLSVSTTPPADAPPAPASQAASSHSSSAGSTHKLHVSAPMASPVSASPVGASTGPHGATNAPWESALRVGSLPMRPSRAPLLFGLAVLGVVGVLLGVTRPWTWQHTSPAATAVPTVGPSTDVEETHAAPSSSSSGIEGSSTSVTATEDPKGVATSEPTGRTDKPASSGSKKPQSPSVPPKPPVTKPVTQPASGHPPPPVIPTPPTPATARPKMY